MFSVYTFCLDQMFRLSYENLNHFYVCLHKIVVYVVRKPRIGDNPWIALRKAWIRALRGQSVALAQSTDCATHTCVGVFGSLKRAGSCIMVDRNDFEEYLSSSFVQKKKSGSKVISRAKGEEIVAYLSAAGEDVKVDAHFKFWVKSRGFRLLDYPVLGLKNVLCLPAKKKVPRKFRIYTVDISACVQDKNDNIARHISSCCLH